MIRLLRSLSIGVIVTAMVVSGACWLLLGTQPGGRWLVAQGLGFVPGAWVVRGQRGTVFSGLSARRVVYRDESLHVELTDVRIDVQLVGLLRKQILIRHATAAALETGDLTLTGIGLAGSVGLRDDFPLAVHLDWTGPDGRIGGTGDFSGTLEELAFTHRLTQPVPVEVSGTVRSVLTQPSIDVTAHFAAWPLTVDDRQIVLRDGHARLTGTADTLILEQAGVTALGGQISATGSARLHDGATTASITIAGANLDPAMLRAGLDGQLDFSARLEMGSTATVNMTLDSLSGEFLAQPVDGAGTLRLQDGRVERAEMTVSSGPNRLELSGGLMPEFAGQFRFSAPELSALWPGLDGTLEGHGQFGGTPESPTVNVQADGKRVQVGGFSLDRISLHGRVAADGGLDWSAQVADINSDEFALGHLQMRARGSLADHHLALRLSGGVVEAQIQARGAWHEGRLQETFESAVIDSGVAGAWTLRKSVAAQWAADDGSIEAHCWSNPPAEICTNGVSWRAGRWQGAGTLRHFPLATFNPWLGEEVRINGEADADLSVDWQEGSVLNAAVSWRQGETRLSFSGDEANGQQDEIATTLRDLRFTLSADKDIATLESRVSGDYGLTLQASASLDDPLGEDGALTGKIDMQIPDIGQLRPMINRFVLTSAIGGELTVGAEISGTLSTPVIQGRADLRKGSATIEANGIELIDANLSMTGLADSRAVSEGGSALTVEGSVRSGRGQMQVNGQVDWTEEHGIFSDLHLSGNNFEIWRQPNQRIVVTPDIDLSLHDRTLALSGRVLVPEAEFVLREFGPSAVAISKDVVVHGEHQSVARSSPGPRLVGSLDLQLGDRVSFSGFGIETHLAGGLKLVETVDTPLAAEGSLQLVDGQFETLGKVLTIERGSLNFYGPLNDPVLDVRAVRRLKYRDQNIRVGVIVSGPISSQLEFVLFSDPVYSDEDILSFLLVDRPASTADGASGNALSGAALTLGLQSWALTQGLGEGFNLDEVALEGAGGDDTTIVAGKQLSDDIYVRYTYGLFNRIGTVLIRYDLGHGFSLEAGSGEQQTLDLLYSIDR